MLSITRKDESQSPARRADESLWAWWDPARTMRELMGWDPWSGGAGAAHERAYVPRFNVRETATDFVFWADLPGVKQDDVQITLTGNELRISGHREEVRKEENDRCALSECEYGAFTRVFVLPEGAEAEKARAEMKDGVLTLSVPKRPEVQPKQISIKAG